jgi:hypothetical protein
MADAVAVRMRFKSSFENSAMLFSLLQLSTDIWVACLREKLVNETVEHGSRAAATRYRATVAIISRHL